jgi:hypothetical protein
MKRYCVRLSAIKPDTAERQIIIVNNVTANSAGDAGRAAIARANLPASACVRFVSARRTDNAFWTSSENQK